MRSPHRRRIPDGYFRSLRSGDPVSRKLLLAVLVTLWGVVMFTLIGTAFSLADLSAALYLHQHNPNVVAPFTEMAFIRLGLLAVLTLTGFAIWLQCRLLRLMFEAFYGLTSYHFH